ncbi:Caspase recruitment domain-containing protein 10 [Lonchura striata]|uniref:Caspase recruitment domain-containing protein 10 n=1 Tax=Lonchura striata TaxID=40157 RepID=A0A218UZ31_9PASE|nr:Caspase recruitment domain-containing protein 10 [Lonchura striata domestica]
MAAVENVSLQASSLSEQEEEEDTLWEKIESARHQLTRSLNPAKLTPYLRQCRVIDEQDEEEVLNSCRFPCKSNQTGYLMDILRRRGKRGYEAFLESLEFYYPEQYTRLTGREPAQRCSMILDEEGPEGLTQFLMMEVKKVRAQRKEHLLKEHQLQVKNQALEQEQVRLEQQLKELLKVQERCQRLREEWESNSVELLRLKDENYMMAMRYAQLCEEKNVAVLRSRDLQLLVDQLKCKVSSLEEECSLLRKQASAPPQREAEERGHPDTVSELWAENQRLTASLQELQGMLQKPGEGPVPGSEQILLDILEHDWKEAQDDRQDLCQKLNSLQNELQWAEELRDKYLQEVEDLQLKYRTLQKDCDLYKHRMNTVLLQLEEIEKERDQSGSLQAIQSRDGVQLQYSQSLIEKDQYRKRVRALEEERDELLSKLSQAEGLKSTLEAQLQRCQGSRSLSKMCSSSYSLCSNLSSTWSLIDNPVNGIMDTLGTSVTPFPGDSAIQSMDETPDSEKDINRLSTFPFPPCIGSILRRQREERCMPHKSLSCGSFSSIEDSTGSSFPDTLMGAFSSSSSSTYTRVKSEICLSTLSSRKEVARRSLVVQLSSVGHPSHPSPQEKRLGADISILGGNRTGIYVQWVKPGSRVEKTGLREGCRLIELRVPSLKEEVLSLENCTREVAYLSLLHWDEPSSLIFQLDLEGYQPLQAALEEGKKFAGDSFYVRTNVSLLELSDPYALCVKCREILHVTDTMHRGRLEWYCSRVDPLTVRDLDKGTVPNYSRAHQLLKIQEKRQMPGQQRGHKNNLKKRALGQLRLVKSKPQRSPEQPPQQLWLDPCSDPDTNLKPYTLVRPVVVKTPRPVVLLPSCIAPRLIRNLLDLPTSRLDFHVCSAEKLAGGDPSTTHTQEQPVSRTDPQDQRESGRIHMIREAMEKVLRLLVWGERARMGQLIQTGGEEGAAEWGKRESGVVVERELLAWNKHCLLELGVEGVRDLIKSEIYPIIIHVEVTEKNVRGLRSLLGKAGQRDSEVLKACRAVERALHALPCSWARVEPHAWSHAEELPKVVRGCIFQEQTRPLWIEEGDD